MLVTYLQKELGWTPAQVAVPVFWGNIITFLASSFWGAVSEKVGRRWALMIPTFISIFIAPLSMWRPRNRRQRRCWPEHFVDSPGDECGLRQHL